MNLIDTTHKLFAPAHYTQRRVENTLEELDDRERPGDQDLYFRLDVLNTENQALEPEVMSKAFRSKLKLDDDKASLQAVRESVAERQSGFARRLARTVMTDGAMTGWERTSIEKITEQPSLESGQIAMLAREESTQLWQFAQAPNDSVRAWMTRTVGPVTLKDARALGPLLFDGNTISRDSMNFAADMKSNFGAPLNLAASTFLQCLGQGKRVEESLLRARKTDQSHGWESQSAPGPLERVGLEARTLSEAILAR